jgi:predicted RNase H-like nuclease (RuvC/YqgF family)
MNNNYIIRFGKYKGKTLSVMMNDTKYIEWIKTTDIPNKVKEIHDAIYPPQQEEETYENDESEDYQKKDEQTNNENDDPEQYHEEDETIETLLEKNRNLEETVKRLRIEIIRLNYLLKN